VLLSTTSCTYAPADPAVPLEVTPVVYSVPPPCVPSAVVENFNACPAFEESDKSNLYVPTLTVSAGLT
jgi:hypothetical protein